MRSVPLATRSLRYHWRMHAAAGLGVAVAASVLTGALLVGDSMRGSLRDLAIERLGATDSALIAPRFVLESLAERLEAPRAAITEPRAPAPDAERRGSARADIPTRIAPSAPVDRETKPPRTDSFCPLIAETGAINHSDRATRAAGVSVLGIDERFWRFHGVPPPNTTATDDRSVILNDSLAHELGAAIGDDVLLRFGKKDAVSTDSLLGRRDDTVATLRLTIRAIIPARGLGAFSLRPQQGTPKNAFVPLRTLQRAAQQTGRVNVILHHDELVSATAAATSSAMHDLNAQLSTVLTLEDVGLILRSSVEYGYLSLESDAVFLDPVALGAGLAAAADLSLPATPLLAYLVNSITTGSSERSIPYSTAVGIDPRDAGLLGLAEPRHGTNDGNTAKPENTADAEKNAKAENTAKPGDTALRKDTANGTNPASPFPKGGHRGVDPANGTNPASPFPKGGHRGVRVSNAAADPQPTPSRSGVAAVVPELNEGEIILRKWATDDLDATIGDQITLTYFVTSPSEQYITRSDTFRLAAIVLSNGDSDATAPADKPPTPTDDPGLVPPYRGITDTENLADWDAPFPLDLTRIRPKDEAYWKNHRTAPKVFLNLADARRLWGTGPNPDETATALRIHLEAAGGAAEPPDQAAHDRNARAASDPRPPNNPLPVDAETMMRLDRSLRQRFATHLSPSAMGLSFQPVRADALHAATGSTDFSMLFLGFSMFLIAVSMLLTVLLFRLGVERRAADVGLLLAVGFTPSAVSRSLLLEALPSLVVAAAVGVMLAGGYTALMLAGLRTVWSAAANAPFLQFHAQPASYVTGAAVTILLGIGAVLTALRPLLRLPVNRLLRRDLEAQPSKPARPFNQSRPSVNEPRAPALYAQRQGLARADSDASTARQPVGKRGPFFRTVRSARTVAPVLCLFVAAALAALGIRAQALDRAACFFGSGAVAVAGCILALRARLIELRIRASSRPRPPTWTSFGIRNVARNAGRSVLVAGLVASAGFILVAVDSFRLSLEPNPTALESGTGGFTAIAETAAPLPYDLSQPRNWDSLNLNPPTRALLERATVIPFHLRDGDSASCLNLYQKGNPRILGASEAMLARGGFRFATTLPVSGPPADAPDAGEADADLSKSSGSVWTIQSVTSSSNPWVLLRHRFDDGAIPAIGDEAAVLWQLKSGLGRDVTIRDERGLEVPLRFVALLSNSILQGELIILDSHFRTLFPSIEGHAFFLMASPFGDAQRLDDALENDLTRFGFDAQDAVRRLVELQAVQNTYLSAFQWLGGLGLVLGSTGLSVILIRNVWERRRELAVLQTLGIGRRRLVWYLLVESLVLLGFGLASGFVSATLAIAPALVDGTGSPPWATFAWITAGSSLLATVVGVPAVYRELRAPILSALRNE